MNRCRKKKKKKQTMGSGASHAAGANYAVQDGAPAINWGAAANAAEQAGTKDDTQQQQENEEEGTDEESISVAHETVQMIFDILNQNGTYSHDADSMDTVLETAKALANHSHAAALLMSTQRDTQSGDTLLHAAVRVCSTTGDLSVVKLLLTDQFKFDINAQNWKGSAALHICCTSGSNSAGVAEVLLEWNAWTEIQDVEGATPLILSSAAGDDECIKTLLKYHAHIDARDFNGFSALDWAHHYCHTSSVKALGGGDVNHWLQYWDEGNNLPYWFNTGTGESVWHNPMEEAAWETDATGYEAGKKREHEEKQEQEQNEVNGQDDDRGSPPTSDASAPLSKWKKIAWKVGRQRVASKSEFSELARSPSRRTINSPAPPTTPKPMRSPTRTPSRLNNSVSPKKGGGGSINTASPSSSSSPAIAMSPNHGAQIHRQIEMLMKMQADMQDEMRRRLDAGQQQQQQQFQQQQQQQQGSRIQQPAGLAAIEEQRVVELESRLKAKDEELATIREEMKQKKSATGNETPEDGSDSNSGSPGSSGISAEEHEQMLVAARQEVENELKKQKEAAITASKRESEAHEKEKEAMQKVEEMMKELKRKETAIRESRQALADKDADKNETKKALVQQAEQLKEAKHLAAEHQNALQQMRRQHST